MTSKEETAVPPIRVIGTEHYEEQAEATLGWLKRNMTLGQTLAIEVYPGGIKEIRAWKKRPTAPGPNKDSLKRLIDKINGFWQPIIQYCDKNNIKLVSFSPYYPARLQSAIPAYEHHKWQEQAIRNVLKLFRETKEAANEFGMHTLANQLQQFKSEQKALADAINRKQITVTKEVKKRLGALNARGLSLHRTMGALQKEPNLAALAQELMDGRFNEKNWREELISIGKKKARRARLARLSYVLDFPVQDRLMARKIARARPDVVLCGYHHAQPLAQILQSVYDLQATAKVISPPKIPAGEKRRARTMRNWYAERQRQRFGNQWRERMKTIEQTKMARRRVA